MYLYLRMVLLLLAISIMSGCTFGKLVLPTEETQEGLAQDPTNLKLILVQLKGALSEFRKIQSEGKLSEGADSPLSNFTAVAQKGWGYLAIFLGIGLVAGIVGGTKYGSTKYPIDKVVAALFKLQTSGDIDFNKLSQLYKEGKAELEKIKKSK